tara:strand:- start:876 stop:1169 length:294 start_codon:yes stop_codon:yes gene_type:complete
LDVPQYEKYIREEVLCNTLSGLELPMLTVTSRALHSTSDVIQESEFDNEDGEDVMPKLTEGTFKKHVIVTARVHPGETVASFIMEGFIKFITSPTNK